MLSKLQTTMAKKDLKTNFCPCWSYLQQDMRKQHTNLIVSSSFHIWRVAYARFVGDNSNEGGRRKAWEAMSFNPKSDNLNPKSLNLHQSL